MSAALCYGSCLFVLPLLLSTLANADEWVVLNPHDFLQYEVIRPNVSEVYPKMV